MSHSLQPHELEHSRLPCPSLSPGICSNSCSLSQRCHPTISLSVAPFSSCPQSFMISGSFPMSQLFASGSQSVGASASASVTSSELLTPQLHRRASLVAQMVKNLPACRRPRFDHWLRKIPWRREWLPTPVFLPGEFLGQRNLVGYSPWGHKELGTTEQLSLFHFQFHRILLCKGKVGTNRAYFLSFCHLAGINLFLPPGLTWFYIKSFPCVFIFCFFPCEF